MAAVDFFSVRDHVILVTGASSGLGAHFARMLASRGAIVVLAARRLAPMEALVAEIEAAGGRASAVTLDVLDRASVKAAIQATLQKHGRIDTVINNAGILVEMKMTHDNTEEDFESVVGTNLTGAWRVSVEAASQWMLKNGGNIVMIGSIMADRTVKGSSAYLAAKAGAHQLTKALALEWAGKGIRVNALAPGYVLTDLVEHLFMKKNAEGKSDGYTDAGANFVKGIPMKSFVELDDLSGPLIMLCSSASRKMTGSIITVDGGHTVSSL